MYARRGWACSSAGEHYVDIVGVTGSIPVTPTIQPLDSVATARRPSSSKLRKPRCRSRRQTHDGVSGDQLSITQQAVADALGLRRATGSEVCSRLEAEGLIDTRGAISGSTRRRFSSGAPANATGGCCGAADRLAATRFLIPVGTVPLIIRVRDGAARCQLGAACENVEPGQAAAAEPARIVLPRAAYAYDGKR